MGEQHVISADGLHDDDVLGSASVRLSRRDGWDRPERSPVAMAPVTAKRFGVHGEFGVLREVVIGTVEDVHLPPPGPSVAHYNPKLQAVLRRNGDRPLPMRDAFPERHERTVEQLEAIAETYRAAGVVVHRPRPFDAYEHGHLADLQPGRSQLYPADPVFVLGTHFLELSIRRAYRRKEVFPLRDLVLPMIQGDPEAHHVAMPLSRPGPVGADAPGPFLEGGDIVLHGRDVIVGCGELCSNEAGVEWLRRYLAPWGYEVHPMRIAGPVLHALGIMCLLREGLLMAHLPSMADGLPAPLCGWDVIKITREEMEAHATVGVSLDPRHHMIDPRHERIMGELVRHGVEPIPTPCDAIGFWGGAIRCVTLPLRRDPA